MSAHVARLSIRVKPRASRPGLVGVGDDDVVHLAVSSPPAEGKANDEVARMLAKLLGVPRRAVTLARGERSRDKLIDVAGLSAHEALAELRRQA